MPRFEFDLESFSTVAIEADDEAAARKALDAMLLALGEAAYVIGEARCAGPRRRPRGPRGRPPQVRRQLARIVALRAGGASVAEIAHALGVHRGSVHRALRQALGETR